MHKIFIIVDSTIYRLLNVISFESQIKLRLKTPIDRDRKHGYIAIVGDLNNTPERDPLQPLLGNNSDLIDVMNYEKYVGKGLRVTCGHGYKKDKLD